MGYFVQPGGKWSGDYLVADFEQLRKDPESPPAKCSVHRTSEVFFRFEALSFPLFEYREKRALAVVERPQPANEPPAIAPHQAPGQIDMPPEVVVPGADVAVEVPEEAPAVAVADRPADDLRGTGEELAGIKIRR